MNLTYAQNYSDILLRKRSSHRRCSVKKVYLEISQNSLESTCARVSFLIKLQSSASFLIKLQASASACNFIKKETLAQVFIVNFAKFLRKSFLAEHLRWVIPWKSLWIMILKADFVKKATKSCYHGKHCKYVIYIFGRDFTIFFKHCNLILRLWRNQIFGRKIKGA